MLIPNSVCVAHGWRPRQGEREPERTSITDRALQRNLAAVQLHESLGDCQTQSGALTDALGRRARLIEVVEDGRVLFLRNANPRVGDRDRREVPELLLRHADLA